MLYYGYDYTFLIKFMAFLAIVFGTLGFFFLMYDCSDTLLCSIPIIVRYLMAIFSIIGITLMIYEYFGGKKGGELFYVGAILSSPVILTVIGTFIYIYFGLLFK
jgi:hypothetical protein